MYVASCCKLAMSGTGLASMPTRAVADSFLTCRCIAQLTYVMHTRLLRCKQDSKCFLIVQESIVQEPNQTKINVHRDVSRRLHGVMSAYSHHNCNFQSQHERRCVSSSRCVQDVWESASITSECWMAAAANPVIRLPEGKLGMLQLGWECCFAEEVCTT